MATPFTSLKTSGIPLLSDADAFKSTLQSGYLFFICGDNFYDEGIKLVTHSPLTHVGIVFQDQRTGKWLVLEAQIGVNVRVGSLDYYLKQKSQIVIARHLNWSEVNTLAMLKQGFGYLDDKYDTLEILKIICAHVDPDFVVHRDHSEFICSELVFELLTSNNQVMTPQKGGNTPSSVGAEEYIEWVSAFSHP